MVKDFVLASCSPQRRALLEQIGMVPIKIEPANINETPLKNEKATAYVKRMALEKARNVAEKNPNKVVLACDTIILANAKIIQKAHSDEEQIKVMKTLSGKSHKVLSAVCIIDTNGKQKIRLSTTKILMKNLSDKEIKDYVATKEWVGCAGYKIEGCLSGFVRKIIGSYSGVVGLPLFETRNLLNGVGIY